jgi:hypothetical protein
MLCIFAIIDGFVLKKTVCLMMCKLTNAPHLNFLGKILIKYSKDTQQLLISHYICNWVNDVTWLQNEISQELSMGTKIFKRSYHTVLRAFSFKKIKILIMQTSLTNIPIIINIKKQTRLFISTYSIKCNRFIVSI